VAESLHHLAGMAAEQGHFAEAQRMMEQSLQIIRKQSPLERQEVAAAYSTLAMIFFEQGKFEDAERWDAQALAINRKLNDEPRIASDLMNICLDRTLLNKRDGLEQDMQEVLTIHRKLYGNEHLKIATDLNNLGGVLYYE
jgi:tetratricopeptide (TPR) repeat protein